MTMRAVTTTPSPTSEATARVVRARGAVCVAGAGSLRILRGFCAAGVLLNSVASVWPVGAAPPSRLSTEASEPPFVASSDDVASSLDGLAAVLGGGTALEPVRTILRSDVELRARLSLMGRNSDRALFGELPRGLLQATLLELIGENLIALEAERVQITPPGAADISRELGEIEREAGGRQSVAQLLGWVEASRLELDAVAERRALIGAFLRANLEGVTVVTEAEVDTRLRDDAERYAGAGQQSREAVRAAVRAVLAKEALTRHIEHWVRVLRARTRVRVFAVYDSP
ncbi:MAG: hypothetical protein RL701_6993 [Pseudomonadota bacterium]